jgi:hypothetical protein
MSDNRCNAQVAAVLNDSSAYDDLDDAGQALVRAEWERRDAARLAVLDFTALSVE